MRGGEGGEHPAPFENLHGPRRTGRGHGIRHGHAGVEPLRQGHTGAGVDDDGHARRKHHFVLGDPLEIEIGRSEGGQCPEPQSEKEQTDPTRQFGRIAPVHPRHPGHHGDEHRDQQRHLPPLRETLQQRAGDAVLHHVGGGQAEDVGEGWHGGQSRHGTGIELAGRGNVKDDNAAEGGILVRSRPRAASKGDSSSTTPPPARGGGCRGGSSAAA